MRRVVKELLLFVAILAALSLATHFDAWTSHPLQQLEALPQSPLGPWHPIYITLAVYGALLVLRGLFAGVKKFLKRG